MVGVIILAAGASRRMGSPKLLLEHQGTSLLALAVRKARQLALGYEPDVVVVVGRYADLYTPVATKAGARVVVNAAWNTGLASSLQAGVQALDKDVSAALLMLADQPFVPVAHLKRLCETFYKCNASLIFSEYHDTLGAPAVIGASHFQAVTTLQNDKGAKALITSDTIIKRVALKQAADIDTPADAHLLDSAYD